MSRARAATGLVALLACAAAVAPALGAEGRVREVSIPGQTYAPSQLQVLVGDTVLWRNGDVMNHTVTSDGVGFDSGYLCARVDVSSSSSRRRAGSRTTAPSTSS